MSDPMSNRAEDVQARHAAGDYLETAILLAVMEEDEAEAQRLLRQLGVPSMREFRGHLLTLLDIIAIEFRQRRLAREARDG